MVNNIHFIDPHTAFMQCFNTDEEREQYMYMYSIGNTHYFKHIGTRKYISIKIRNGG